MMKNTILIVFMTIIFMSCTVQKREKFSYNLDKKQSWISGYKYEVFYGCIKEGIGNDSLRIILEKKDLFNQNSDIDFPTIDKARALGSEVIKKMPKAYIKIDKGEEYLKQKNFISHNCLVYYASKELDSIANVEYEESLSKN